MAHRYPTLIAVVCATIVLAIVALLTACEAQSTRSFTRMLDLASFTERDVQVEIALEIDQQGRPILAGTFTPTEPRGHLYSKDLPPHGIDGAGRPTQLKILSGLKAAGDVFADRPTTDLHLEGFDQAFPVYPDGPVTLRLPIELPRSDGAPIHARLSITYMVCSSGGLCLPPVLDKSIEVTVPVDVLSHNHD
jgi:hypothetical protein